MNLLVLVTGIIFSYAQGMDLYEGVNPKLFRTETSQVKEHIQSIVKTPKDFIEDLNKKNWELLCIGETHDNDYRKFIAGSILDGLQFDQMMIETEADKTRQLVTAYETGQTKIPMLGAEFSDILKAAFSKIPTTEFFGVEVVKSEKGRMNLEELRTGRTLLSRETFIAQHITDLKIPGKTAVLYGASHCANRDIGGLSAPPFFTLLNQTIAGEKVSIKVQKFAFSEKHLSYLQRFGATPPYALDLNSLDPKLVNYRNDIIDLKENYDYLVVFK
jgi:hypothetical protein